MCLSIDCKIFTYGILQFNQVHLKDKNLFQQEGKLHLRKIISYQHIHLIMMYLRGTR